MADTNDTKESKREITKSKSEPKQKIERTPEPRELTPEELKSVAGGPIIFNDF